MAQSLYNGLLHRCSNTSGGAMRALKIIGLALIAGGIAISINILLLNLADALGIVTARGGLQRLVKLWVTAPITRSGIGEIWGGLGLPGPDSAVFRTGFKVCVGLGMAIFYALVLETRLPGGTLSKGLAYALFAWLLNAFAVLPLLGEGIAGSRVLTVFGMLWFAVAHTVFFIAVAVIYERFTRSQLLSR